MQNTLQTHLSIETLWLYSVAYGFLSKIKTWKRRDEEGHNSPSTLVRAPATSL